MRKFLRGVVAATALSAAAYVAPAVAVTGAPPTPQDDHYTVRAGDFRPLDVLANDTDPDGDSLQVCRVRNVPRALLVESDGDMVLLGTSVPGTFTFTYYACDFSYLSPATVTITVKPRPKMYLVVRKSVHPGMLRVADRGSRRFTFAFGSYKEKNPDKQFTVKPHTSQLVPVRRTSLIWVAYNERFATFRVGIIRGITLPPHTDELPPGAPPKGTGLDFRTAGRAGFRWNR